MKQHDFDQHNACDQLRLCALALSVAAFFLFTYIDLCPQDSVVVLALGTLMLAWTGPLTILAGLHYPRAEGQYKIWQPFEGGFQFVSMQAVGWSLTGLLLAVCLVYLGNFHTLTHFEGQFLLIGITGFISQMVLNVSLDCFVVDAPVPVYAAFPSSNTKAIVAMLLSVTGLLFFVAFDWLLSSSILLILGGALFSVSAVVIHVGIGVSEIKDFALWQPFVGGNVFMLLQYLGWKFFACTLVSSTLMSQAEYYSGTSSFMGIIGFISQFLLLFSLSYFQFDRDGASHTSKRHRLPDECYICAIVLVMTGIFSLFLLYDYLPVECPAKTRTLGLLCLLLVGATTPLTHIGGFRSIHGYHLWQPFVGDSKFIFIQSVGWTWYGIFVGIGLLIFLNNAPGFLQQLLPLACLVGTASWAAISFSMPFFQFSTTLTPSTDYMTPEILLSFLLSTSSILLHLLVEVLSLSGLLASLCLALGLVLSSIAMGVTHISGYRQFPKTYRFWQPFVGGNVFVLRQALGWTFFAISCLFDCVCIASLYHDLTIVRGFVLAVGLLVLVPQYTLASSLQLFQEDHATSCAVLPMTWSSFRLDLPLLANLALVCGTSTLFIAAELCRSYRSLDEVFLVFGTMCGVASMACTHCVCGPHMYKTYRRFQPFRGGLRFVVLQGAAWTLGSVAWMAACTTIYWPSHFFQIDGLLLAIGAMFFTAHVLLLFALAAFDDTSMASETPTSASHPKPNLVLGVMVGIVACCLFAVVDLLLLRYGDSIPAFPTTVCAVLALVISIPTVFYLQGRMVLRVLACTLTSLTVLLGIFFTYSLWRDEAVNKPREPQFFGVLTGSIGLVAHLVLLNSISPNTRALLQDRTKTFTTIVGLISIALLTYNSSNNGFLKTAIFFFQPLPLLVFVSTCCVYLLSVLIFQILHPVATIETSRFDLDEDLLCHFASFLRPQDLNALASTSKHHQTLISQRVWYAQYLHAMKEPLRPTFSKTINFKYSRPFGQSALLSLERIILEPLSISKRQKMPHTPDFPLLWNHVACVVSNGGACYHCEFCGSFEVFTASQKKWESAYSCNEHALSTWVSSTCPCMDPITRSYKVAHRRCIESHQDRSICSIHPEHLLQPLLRAPMCFEEFISSLELRKNALKFFGMGAVVIFMAPYCAPSFILWTVGMCMLAHIVQSDEFDQTVEQIWNDPSAFPLYIRIYYIMALFSVVQLMTPLWTITSNLLQVVFVANSIAFTSLTLIIVFLFWKSRATIVSVASNIPAPDEAPRCILCRLHVCQVN